LTPVNVLVIRRDPPDHAAVERQVLEALKLAESFEMRPIVARCHMRLAWLYERLDRREYENHAAAAQSLLEHFGRPRSLDAAGVH
jgi:uncharacterized protein (DUF2225 family)